MSRQTGWNRRDSIPSNRRPRGPGRHLPMGIVAAILLAFACGCAIHDQVQYFAATDPETGATNYYKMTISGWGGFGTDYHMQAGYFSSASVDVLRGSMPDIPILDLPVEQLEVFDRLAQQFHAALIQEAKQRYKVTDAEARLIAMKGHRQAAALRVEKLQGDLHRARMELARTEADWKAKVAACEAAGNALPARQTAYETAMADYEQDPLDISKKDAADQAATDLKAAQQAYEEAQRKAARASARRDRLFERVQSREAEIALNDRIFTAAAALTDKLENCAGDQGNADGGPGATPAPFGDEEVVALARLVWFGSLSKSDLASIGMTNPYQFRKLVFWATAANIDLNEFAGEIDGVIDNVVTIAGTFKSQAKAQKQERKGQRESLKSLTGYLDLEEKEGAVNSIIDLLSPSGAENAQGSPTGGQP